MQGMSPSHVVSKLQPASERSSSPTSLSCQIRSRTADVEPHSRCLISEGVLHYVDKQRVIGQ